jgi:pimeloyl-ACP methyl ester carboxylesterase
MPKPSGKERLAVDRTIKAALLALGIVLTLASTPLLAAARPGAGQEAGARFEPAACPVKIPADATVACGYLVVPEDRSQPGGREIRLAVAILESHSAEPAPDPVVYLEGGPGGSALEGLTYWLDSPILDGRDLILFEQRGTHYSEPWLDCPELRETYVESWELGLDEEKEIAREVEAAHACRDRLLAEGVDLAAYNSAASAADLEDLRRALGYSEWNLYGISYGTRLALTAMRDHPQGIRSVILDSVYPPALDGYVQLAPYTARVIGKLLADCTADPVCNAAYPQLETDLYQLIEQLNEQPVEVTVHRSDTGERLDLQVDGDYMVAELFMAFYDSSLIPFLPLLIDQVRQGNHSVLLPLTEYTLDTYLSGSDGMNNSVQCYEEAPFNPPEAIAAAAEAVPPLLNVFTLSATLQICELWGAGTAGPIEDEPVYSDIPTLVLAGEYDPITPPAAGRLAAETLSNSFYYEFPGLGHGVTLDSCPLTITLAFLDDPTAEPEITCLDSMRGPEFYTDDDFFLTPAAYRLVMTLNDGLGAPFLAIAGFLGLFILVLMFVVLWIVLRGLGVWTSPSLTIDGLFNGLLAAMALWNIAYLSGLGGAFIGATFHDWSILVFGLPNVARLIFLMPPLSLILTLVWLVFLVIAWVKSWWSLWRCALYSLTALVLLAFFWFLAYWDLLGARF